MQKIIGHARFERATTPYAYSIRVHELGEHHEALAIPRYAWTEIGPLPAQAQAFYDEAASGKVWDHATCDWVPAPPRCPRDVQADLERNQERSARRAKTKIRRLVKAKSLDTMLTLTYRENMQDHSRMRHDLDVFIKAVRRKIPSFEYVCVIEKQKRGALHAHLAVQKIQKFYAIKGVTVRSYELLRSIWRSVVGLDNGNVDVARRRPGKQSVGKLAGYLSKYLTKAIADGARHQNSYSASGGLAPAVTLVLHNACKYAALGAIYDLLSEELARTSVSPFACSPAEGWWFVSLEPSP